MAAEVIEPAHDGAQPLLTATFLICGDTAFSFCLYMGELSALSTVQPMLREQGLMTPGTLGEVTVAPPGL